MKHREVSVNAETRWGKELENQIAVAIQGEQDRVFHFLLL